MRGENWRLRRGGSNLTRLQQAIHFDNNGICPGLQQRYMEIMTFSRRCTSLLPLLKGPQGRHRGRWGRILQGHWGHRDRDRGHRGQDHQSRGTPA